MEKIVGVLALQGAYQKHIDLLHTRGVTAHTVRHAHELDDCNALILPGGESTTISLLMQEYGLYEPIQSFAQEYPVMGVCAGMILMAAEVDDTRVKPLGLMPFRALRNHYGSQIHSCTRDISLDFDSGGPAFRAQFIRAPGVREISENIDVLARYGNESIILSDGRHLALSFHPELTNDSRIHHYWLTRLD